MTFKELINEARKRILRKIIYEEVKKINPRKILDNGSGLKGSFDYKEFREKVTKADILFGIDSQKLPYKNKSFDCVIFAGVIQYLNEPEKAIRECYRVLKKNGVLIITTINKDSFIKRIKGLTNKEKRSFALREFVSFIEKFKFKVVKKDFIDFWFIPKKYRLILYCMCKKI